MQKNWLKHRRVVFHVVKISRIVQTRKLLSHPYTPWPDPCLSAHYILTVVQLLNFAGAHFFSFSPMGKLQHFHCCNHTVIKLVLFLLLLPLCWSPAFLWFLSEISSCNLFTYPGLSFKIAIFFFRKPSGGERMHLCLNHFSLCTLYAFRHFVLCVWPSWSIVTIVPVSAPSAPQSLKLGCNPPTDSHGQDTQP